MGWWRICSIDMGAGDLLLVKCSQTLSKWIKKSSLFCFCKFLCQLYLRICFILKRARPWLEFIINQHLLNTAWDLSWKHWWDIIIFESILFLENLIECLCLNVQGVSKCLGSLIFFNCSGGNCIFSFQFSFWYTLE